MCNLLLFSTHTSSLCGCVKMALISCCRWTLSLCKDAFINANSLTLASASGVVVAVLHRGMSTISISSESLTDRDCISSSSAAGSPEDGSSSRMVLCSTLRFFLAGADDEGLAKYSGIRFSDFLFRPMKSPWCKLHMKQSPVGSHFFPFSADLVRLICAIVAFFISSGIRAMLCSVRISADVGQSVNFTALHPHTSAPPMSCGHLPLRFKQPQMQHCQRDISERMKTNTSLY